MNESSFDQDMVDDSCLAYSGNRAREQPGTYLPNAIMDILRRSARPVRTGVLDDLKAPPELNIQLKGLLDAYQAALDRHAIVAVTDHRGNILFANEKFCRVSGYSEAELLGQSHRIVNSGQHPTDFFIEMWKTIAKGKVWHGEICNRSKEGHLYWVDTTIVPLADPRGRVEAFMSIRYEITKRKAAEEALQREVDRRRKAEALLVDVIETIPDGIAAFDPDDRLVVYNRSYAEFFSRSAEVIRIGATFESILRHGLENGQYTLPRNTGEAREAWCRARLRDHRNPGRRIVQELSDGRWIQIEERQSYSGHTVGTRTDITELKRSEAAIKFHAEHDALTGLLNRSVLERHLGDAMAGSFRSGESGALIILDLDEFKQVNDTMGHAAGDALLVTIARRLQRALRKMDVVVRMGGDEFAIIVPQFGNKADAGKIARKLQSAIQRPTVIQRRTVTPKASLGIAFFPRDGRKLEVLLKKADIALYRAKAEGRGTYRIFSRSMRSRMEHRRKVAEALAAAVSLDAIDVALQPQFVLHDRSHTGFEALARWRHLGQSISPSEFIPVAEERGLIAELGKQVLLKSLQAVRNLRQKGFDTGVLAVNIASAQIGSAGFPAMLEAMVRRHDLLPKDIEIELTENILLDGVGDRIAQSLRQLRAMGFSVALDDFGTGYASLAHLSRFPLDRIKIDRSFVSDMSGGRDACTIVHATIALAHSLGLKVIAEGIETGEQLALLRECNCDFGQGYLISPPLQPRQLPAFLGGCPSTAYPQFHKKAVDQR